MPVDKRSGAADQGSGAARKQMADDETRQELLRKVESLERDFASLHDDARLASLRDELEDLTVTLGDLPGRLSRLRGRGYQFQSFLEKDLEQLGEDWEAVRQRAQATMDREVGRLSVAMKQVQAAVMSARQDVSLPVQTATQRIAQKSAQTENLEKDIRAARDSVRGMYDAAGERVRQVEAQIQDAEQMLDELDAASFRLYPGEAPVAMAHGEWLKSDDDEIKGLLFITDHRIIFERKEEVVTKRRLLVFKDKEQVREVKMEAPVGAVEGAEIERVGRVFKKQVLNLSLASPPAPLRRMSLKLEGDAEAWKGLMNRIITGDIEGERIAGAAKEERVESEPMALVCTGCGASLTVPIVKGMKSVTCEYCGTVIRL